MGYMMKTRMRLIANVIAAVGLVLVVNTGLQPPEIVYAGTITVSTAVDEDIDAGGAGCSLREAIIAANIDKAYGACPKGSGDDTISFALNLSDIVLNTNLPDVMSNITFMGPQAPADSDGTVIIDGGGAGGPYRSGFEITTANVRLIRMTFRNGSAAEGGAISQTGSGILTIDQSLFFNNVSITNGGAIYLTSTPTLTITQSTFSDNRAGGDGGAVYVVSGLSGIKLIDSNLIHNTASNGGAIAVNGSLHGSVTISNSLVVNNDASFQGGVLRNMNSDSAFAVSIRRNSTFLDNDAASGGVIFANVGVMTKLNISDSHFKDNDAGQRGGVFALDSLGTLSVKAATFDNNRTNDGPGGVVFVNNLTGGINVTGSDFTGNEASDGGVVYVDAALTAMTIQMTDGNYVNNQATGTSGGGVLSIGGFPGIMKINGAVFNGNNSAGSGGVLFLPNASLKSLTIANSQFINNRAEAGYGGAIDLGVPTLFTGTAAKVSISKTDFRNNSASSGGGAIYIDTVTSTLSIANHSLFDINSVTNGTGGALNIQSLGGLKISGSTLMANTALPGGGMLYVSELFGPASITESIINGNQATEGIGGAILLDNANLNTFSIVKSSFRSNTAYYWGGAITSTGALMKISGSTFLFNTAGLNGGAMYASGPGSTLSVTSTVFALNEATNGDGGALLVSEAFLTMSRSLFWRNNAAAGTGDAIAFGSGKFHSNCFEENGSVSVYDAAGGNDVTQNWWNDPGGPNQGMADTYFTAGTSNFYDPWLHSRPACPRRPVP
jgi:CSLREA domain-containing protein